MKLYRNIIILILIIALLGAGYYFVYKYEPKEEESGDDTSFKTVTVFKTDKQNISSLEITNPDGSYQVSKGENDKWVINGDKTIKISQSKTDTLMYEAATVSAKEAVSENVTDLYQYGLDNPARKAAITTNDGTKTTILAGDKTVDGSYYFVMVEGESTVYIKSTSGVESLTKSYSELRDSSLYSFTEDELTGITLAKKGNDKIELVKENQGSSEEPIYVWKITAPLEGEVDEYTLGDEVFPKIISLSSDGTVQNKTEAECGISSPYAVYTVSSAKESYTVTVGNEIDANRYVKVSGNDGIYLVASEKIAFIDLQYTRMMNKLIHLENIDETSGVTISGNGKSFVLTHTGSDETDTFTINDKNLNEKNYKKAYQAVLSVAFEDYINENANGTPEVTITYNRKDGKKAEVTFIDYNDRNYVVKVNGGEGRLLVKKKQVEEIFEKLEEIYNS